MELKDRINAVIRTPEYKKAYDQCYKAAKPGTQPRFALTGHHLHLQAMSPDFQKLCADFKIPLPLSPHSPMALEEFPAALALSRMEDGKCIVGTDETLCLHVTIDMTQPLEKIHEAIAQLYSENKVKGLPTTRNRGNDQLSCSIWHVYDLVNKDGLTTYQVAQKFEMNNVPSTDPEADKIYSRYKRAYDKTMEMMDKVRRGIV